jgi:hypothetical protein
MTHRSVACVSLLLAAQCWATDPAPAANPPAHESLKAPLTLDNPAVRKTLREAARQLASDAKSQETQDEKTPTAEIPATKLSAAFRLQPPERQPVVVECRVFDCLGYDATGKVVRTLPPPAQGGLMSADADAWYSCQSGNNMLSTFERFDQCSGIPTTSIFAR